MITGHNDVGSGVSINGFRAGYFRFQIQIKSGTTVNNLVFKPMVVFDSSVLPYHPFAGKSYTITLGQTVYGAKLTIAEDGSVTALVDRAIDKISDLVCVKAETNYQTFGVTPTHGMASGESIALVQSSAWKGLPQDQISSSGDNYVWGSSANGTIRIKTTAYASMTVSEFKTEFADAQLCYYLATPIEIQLDPVQIAAIANQTNNVWADAGDVSVEFAANVKTYIDQKIAAAVAALS